MSELPPQWWSTLKPEIAMLAQFEPTATRIRTFILRGYRASP